MQQHKNIFPPVIDAVCFQENPKANQMRCEMIKNQIRINVRMNCLLLYLFYIFVLFFK